MTSRRSAAHWAAREPGPAPSVDVLIPTAGRVAALAVTLAGLAAQDDPPFRVIVSDQASDGPVDADPVVAGMVRVLRAQGRDVVVHRHLPRRGMAEQRQFLLDQATAPRVLYLDDDVWLEPNALTHLDAALTERECGFVGYAVQGLSFLDDVRPHERQTFAPWERGAVAPERIRRGAPGFERWPLHNAANLVHEAFERDLPDEERMAYRIAWIGGCVMFDAAELRAAGGFDFWPQLPAAHAGEDAVAQWRVMERKGGAGVLPSRAVHLEAPTTVVDRRVEASDIVFGAPPERREPAEAPAREEREDERSGTRSDPGPEVPGRHRLPREQGDDRLVGARVRRG